MVTVALEVTPPDVYLYVNVKVPRLAAARAFSAAAVVPLIPGFGILTVNLPLVQIVLPLTAGPAVLPDGQVKNMVPVPVPADRTGADTSAVLPFVGKSFARKLAPLVS
jgi:hypothetical protein